MTGFSDAIVLCCFGRGGSSVVWNLIGASPDVLMMDQEWHQAAFKGNTLPPRAARALHRQGLLSPLSLPMKAFNRAFAPLAAKRTAGALEPGQREIKPAARAAVMKLMDYHLLFLSSIEHAHASVQPLILTRDPLAQAEGLMRSGLSAGAAGQWCRNVLALMDGIHRRTGAPVFRFEDLISEPAVFTHRLYDTLGLAWPPEGMVRVKVKGYGAQRQGDVDVGQAYRRLPVSELASFLDPAVNAQAIARLSPADREEILSATADLAANFGYGRDRRLNT